DPTKTHTGRAILAADPRLQIHILFASLTIRDNNYWRLWSLLNNLSARSLPWTTADLERLLVGTETQWHGEWDRALRLIETIVKSGTGLTPVMEDALRSMQKKMNQEYGSHTRKLNARITKLLGKEVLLLPDAGETWADMALGDIAALPQETQI